MYWGKVLDSVGECEEVRMGRGCLGECKSCQYVLGEGFSGRSVKEWGWDGDVLKV